MALVLRVIAAAIVALVVYVVLTTLLVFPHSALLFGLLAALLFLAIVFGRLGSQIGRL